MDDLVNLMRLIDLNSEIISEGHYLERKGDETRKSEEVGDRHNSNNKKR